MDKKLKFTGGEPDINWDDLDRDEDANRLALFGIFADFNYGPNDNFIISGCVATLDPGVDVDVTAGYIFLNGEILKVDAQTVVNGGTADLYKYVKATTYETGGNKTFNDGTPRQTWQKNRGIVTAATAPILTTELDVTDGDHFRNGAWQTPTLLNSWAGTVQYRIGMSGRLEFKGYLLAAGGTSSDVAFVLPATFTPAPVTGTAILTAIFDDTFAVRYVKINSNGNFEMDRAVPLGLQFNLDMFTVRMND